ncbi:MAG: prepilin-type N-terminal cleavage/methylation domain-containing protein [Acaryochloridaceae cyanobacterium SU_2_1]|nr:prepilin-type N-terminal cleavage/methylation domain-containing protein [Acaryochloridaceae cyanobacterium SU_2_1]
MSYSSSQLPLYLYLLRSKSSKGFTLIELLVTIIIIGILSSLALPSMLQQSLKAKQSAAKSYIGAVNRAQQTYRLEHEVFASDMTELKADIPLTTENYTYSFGLATTTLAEFRATPTNDLLNAFSGCTYVEVLIGNNSKTRADIKEQAAAGSGTPATPPNC